MDILGIIPARYGSTRFPGKPLANIGGKSMIRRVHEQCLKANSLRQVIVATDDDRIADHVASFGGQAVMTSPEHANGTARCLEALQVLQDGQNWDAVINIQGDEPFIYPQQIDLLCGLLDHPDVGIGTLVKKIRTHEELFDPNLVKVVLDNAGRALYFSRSPIPYFRDLKQEEWPGHHDYYKHIGIYGYRSEILEKLPGLGPSSLEKAEGLEQLRWLSYGFSIHTAITQLETISIDTPADLSKITNIT